MSRSFIRELAISVPILIVVVLLGAHLVVVPTGSMKPVINEGDVVLFENNDVLGLFSEFNSSNIKTGDIIIYDFNSSSTIHRVVAINDSDGGKYYTLKGDANDDADNVNVTPEMVTGKVLTWGSNPITIPKIGWVILWFNGGSN